MGAVSSSLLSKWISLKKVKQTEAENHGGKAKKQKQRQWEQVWDPGPAGVGLAESEVEGRGSEAQSKQAASFLAADSGRARWEHVQQRPPGP